ncbi:MAG: DUF4350 domain-containing protein [Gemmatimonadaceae bacterium]
MSDRRWITSATILSAVAVLAVIFALFAPQESAGSGPDLSSYSVSLNGARGLYDVLQRLGYPVRRRTTSMSANVFARTYASTSAPLDSTATYMVLRPSIPLTAVELNSLLAAVRHGATVVIAGDRGPLNDSLGFEVQRVTDGFHTIANTMVAGGSTERKRPTASLGPGTFGASALMAVPISATIALSPGTHVRDTAFMWLVDSPTYARDERRPAPARALVIGRTFGRGYAIAVATGDLISNQLLRDGRPAIAIVRALDWTRGQRAGTAAAIVFDEYHHGFGIHADPMAAVQRALVSTPLGRMALQAAVAAIVLIMAFGARPLSPTASSEFPRRSPIEHVGALAHAYLQVDARRIGTDRLIHGLRRRHPLGVARSLPHDAYLAALRTQLPATAPDVNVVSVAMAHESTKQNSFASVGAAIANIERAFRS